jgi:hypothetical protein
MCEAGCTVWGMPDSLVPGTVSFDVDNPNTPPRASQKLIATATLMRAMPAPSTPAARNLHREA